VGKTAHRAISRYIRPLTALTAENAEGAEKNSDKGKETTLTLLLTVP